MNQSRLLERKILVNLITDSPKGRIARDCYKFYRRDFVAVFSEVPQLDEEQARELYVKAFPMLTVELLENKGNKLGNGTLFSGLVLMGCALLKKIYPDFDEKSLQFGSPYSDSDLLLWCLKAENTLVGDAVRREFKEPVLKVFCKEHSIEISSREVKERILQPYEKAYGVFLINIRDGKVIAPMKATLFTYFYRIFKNKALEDNRKRGEQQAREEPTEEMQSYQKPEESSGEFFEYLIDVYGDKYDLGRDSKELVRKLMSQLDEVCRKIITWYYLEGKPLVALEEELGVSNLNVKVKRCRKKLRDLLN